MTYSVESDELYHPRYDLDFNYNDPKTAITFMRKACGAEEHGMNSQYPVGCAIFGIDKQDRPFYILTPNTIPEIIQEKLSHEDALVDGHPTVHAEMEGVILLPPFKRISFCVSRPVCPTCLEGISELKNIKPEDGTVDTVHIDSASLKIGSTQEKWEQSSNMIKKIAKRGQLGVAFLDIQTGEKEWFVKRPSLKKKSSRPVYIENAVQIDEIEGEHSLESFSLKDAMGLAQAAAKNSTVIPGEGVIILGRDAQNKWHAIQAACSLPPGFSARSDKDLFEQDRQQTKRTYQYLMPALKRAMMAAIKGGISLEGGVVVATRVPPSGMMVNAIGYGLETLVTPHGKLDMGQSNHKQLAQFVHKGILEHQPVDAKNPYLKNGNGKGYSNGHHHTPELDI